MQEHHGKEHSHKRCSGDQRFGGFASIKIPDGYEQAKGLRAGRKHSFKSAAP